MEIRKDEIIMMPLKSIKPYKNNSKKHPARQIEKIAKSIEQFGFTVPVLVDAQNNVIAGHGRCLAAKRLGASEIPVIKKEEWTEDEIKAYRVLDNKLSETEHDDKLLTEEIESILSIDVKDFLFDVNIPDAEEKQEKKVEFKVKEKHDIIIHCKDDKSAQSVHALIYKKFATDARVQDIELKNN